MSQLSSPRSSVDVQRESLALLEGILADVLLSQSSNQAKQSLSAFLQLQDTFQYNSMDLFELRQLITDFSTPQL